MRNHRPIRLICRAIALALLTFSLAACAGGSGGMGDLAEMAGAVLPRSGGLDNATVVAGLKEALSIGTDRSVSRAHQQGGYLDDPLIRIGLPEQFEKPADALRTIGLGGQVDELELTMNRAAESAAGGAAPVFVDAIKQMSFDDARAILDGNDRAATDYFESKTRAELGARFAPVIDRSMREVGLARVYDDLVGRLTALPLVDAPQLDMRTYVREHALDGLFTLLAQEEARIREDPAARTTALLQKVFVSN